MKSKAYSSDYIKSSSKGQLWISAFLALGFLMAFPVAVLIAIDNWHGLEIYTLEQIELLYENLWRDGLMSTGFAVIACAAILNGINNFWYLYSSRKTDFYHSLPIKRSRIFWYRAFTGVIYYLLPYVFMEFAALCAGAMKGFFSLKIVGMAVCMLLLHLLLYLLIYFSTVLVICVTGNLLMGALCLGGLFLYGGTLGLMLGCYRELFYATTYSTGNWGLLKFLEKYASPVFLAQTFLEKYAEESGIGVVFTAVLAVTVVLGVLAYTAYLKRASESAGTPMIFRWIGVVIKFMVTVPFGLGIGLFFLLLADGRTGNGTIWWIFGMVLGTVFIHGMMEVLFQLDFRKFFSKKLHLLIAGAMVAACAAVYQGDLLHFDSYLPEQEELAAVNFDFSFIENGSYDPVKMGEDGYYHNIDSWDSEEAVMTGNNGLGTETWKTLKNIISAQRKIASRFRYAGSVEYDDSEMLYSLPVKYTLKSGQEIYREYNMRPQDIYDLMNALYEEGDLKELKYAFLEIEDQYLESVDASFIDGDGRRLFQDEPEKYGELLDALRADVEEASAAELLGLPCVSLLLNYQMPYPAVTVMGVESDTADRAHLYQVVFVYPTFERTVAILKETGYPMSMEEVTLESVEISYNTRENDSTVIYEEEELEQLKPALVPSFLDCSWIEYDDSLDAYFMKKGDFNEYYARILKEKEPDFVRNMEADEQSGEEVSETESIEKDASETEK